ncbi:MAG: hypothetical protein V4773_03015 [Verrucomicrobiota bacterium]
MKKKIVSYCSALCLSAVAAFAATAPGGQPFDTTATTTDGGPPVTLQAQGSNFFDFLESLINTQGSFSSLNNRQYTASMTFLGIPNAIRFATNAAGNSVNITLTPTGFNRTFTGVSKADVDDQLENFFKSEGQQTIADFLKAVAKTSPIAVTDGNPTAATAVSATSSFTSQGFTPLDELGDNTDTASGASKPKFGGVSLGLNAGEFEAGLFSGKVYDISGTLFSFGGETVRLVMPFSFNYLELDTGSKVGGAGTSLALPIRFMKMGKDGNGNINGLNWRVTPLFGVSVRGSVDLASLSPLWNAGVVNTIDYPISPKLVISMVNQFTMHRSISIAYDDLDFDPNIDQQIIKNGLRLTTPFNRRWVADGFAVDTRFLKDAAVKQFWTFGGSLAFRATQRWNLVLGLNYDTGDDFKAFSGGLSSAWKW